MRVMNRAIQEETIISLGIRVIALAVIVRNSHPLMRNVIEITTGGIQSTGRGDMTGLAAKDALRGLKEGIGRGTIMFIAPSTDRTDVYIIRETIVIYP